MEVACSNIGTQFYLLGIKKNCAELYKSGERINGVYTIDPDGSGAFDVFCDQKSAGGGWTVFQKRLDGSVNFNRGWVDYKRGFGNLNGEFWLGLDKIHRLTKTKSRLRVELEDTQGKTAYAEYDLFAVSSERTKYILGLGTYSGEFLQPVYKSVIARFVFENCLNSSNSFIFHTNLFVIANFAVIHSRIQKCMKHFLCFLTPAIKVVPFSLLSQNIH